MNKGRSGFERDPERAVDSPSLSAEDGDMTSAEDSSDLEWNVFFRVVSRSQFISAAMNKAVHLFHWLSLGIVHSIMFSRGR